MSTQVIKSIKSVTITGSNLTTSSSDVIIVGDSDFETEYSKPWLRIGTIIL